MLWRQLNLVSKQFCFQLIDAKAAQMRFNYIKSSHYRDSTVKYIDKERNKIDL